MSWQWTTEETLSFIETYRSEAIIWDPKEKLHKERNKVNDAWGRISDAMAIPVAELKKKKETLMTSFRTHHKRKKASIKSGMGEEDVYKPIWLYYEPMAAFLSDVYECCSIINTEEIHSDENSVQNAEQRSEGTAESSNPDQPRVQIPIKKRRSANAPGLEQSNLQVKEAFTQLNQALSEKRKEDDCELYGKLVAKKLRELPILDREETMYVIDGILLQKRRELSKTHSFPSSTCSSYSSSPAAAIYVDTTLLDNDESQVIFSTE